MSLEDGDAGIAGGRELALALGAINGMTLFPSCFELIECQESSLK